MLIVVMILGVLATVAILGVATYRTTSAEAACDTQKAQLKTAYAAYQLDNPGAAAPANLGALTAVLVPTYMNNNTVTFPPSSPITYTVSLDVNTAISGCTT